MEQLEQRQMLAGDCALAHNADYPADVNRDSFVSPVDALLTINHLIDVNSAAAAESVCPRSDFAYDVNNDGNVSPSDAIKVINRLIDPDKQDLAEPEAGDIELKIGEQTSVVYNTNTGEISFDSEIDLRIVQMISESGLFIPDNAMNLNGDFDIARPREMTKIAVDEPFFRTVSLGNIAPIGLTADFLADDLRIEGAPSTGGILTNDWLNIGVEFQNEFGHPLHSVDVGDNFEVVLTVEDHRPGPIDLDVSGVFAAYADATFDPALAVVDGALQFSPTYDLARSGVVGIGSIDELGAATDEQTPLGREKRELVRWTMTATSGGPFGVDLSWADDLPTHDSLMYGLDVPLDRSLIEFDDDARLDIIGDVIPVELIRIEIGSEKFVVYDPTTGELSTESDEDDLRIVQILSESQVFLPDNALNLDGAFDIKKRGEITKVSVDPPFWGNLSFGNVLPTGLSEQFLADDLKIEGAPSIGGTLTADWIDVAVRFETSVGQSIESTVSVGEAFDVVIDVTTRQPGPIDMKADVFTAYVDAMFDRSLVSIAAEGVTSDDFTLENVSVEPWGLDEIGGTALPDGANHDGVQTLARITAIATAPGEFTVETSPPDVAGNGFQFVDGSGFVNPFRVEFNSASIAIVGDVAGPRDLVAFAQAIAASGATFYGAAWCPHCTAQKQLFEDGARYLPFVEVTNPDRSRNQIGEDNNITTYPTWVFGDGSRHEGQLTLEELSSLSGITIPTGDAPHIASPVIDGGTITVLAGSPLHIPLDGYDPNGDPLIYTVTTDDSMIVTGELREENRRLQISVQSYGDMVFHLFDEEAPRVTEQITSLAESGFYDGITFHRIIDNFVIQGGDPTGTGSGGSNLSDFDDQYDVDLQHNRDGILSMAKAADDTNNSQFFITDQATRHLDFNHSIFGQLIEGDDVRDAINSTATVERDRPVLPITMESVDVFEDSENGMLRLFANAESGTTTVYVTAEDVDGNKTTISFDVAVQADSSNSPPFLQPIPAPIISDGGVIIELDAVDAENDPINFDAMIVSGDAEIDINTDTGRLFVTSQGGGVVEVLARVSGDGSAGFDEQRFEIDFDSIDIGDTTTIDLLAESDSGVSQLDNITNAAELMIAVPNKFVGKEIEIRSGALVLTSQLIESSDTVLTVDATNLNDGVYPLSLFDVVAAESFAGFTLTVDRAAPVAIEIPAINAIVGVVELVDLQHPEEGTHGFAYENEPGDALLTIDRSSGVINLLPLSATTTPMNARVLLVDAAGNETTQSFSYEVSENPDPIINLLGFANESGVEFFFDDGVGSGELQLEFGPDGLDLVRVGDNADLPAASFPAIRFNGNVAENVRSIEDIATFIGFDLTREEPVVLTDMVIPASTAKIVPLGARDSDDVTASSDDPSVEAYVSRGNPHLNLNVVGYGTMVFEIFESHVPELARHLTDLVASGYYDGLEVYRVNDDLIQAGDPTNLGISAANPSSVDDQFHPHLRHAQSGMLSMAKLVDDGIGGNFFVTSRAIPEFDFHYSVVGQIVDGEEVQAAIESAQTVVGGFPKEPIVISSASMSTDPSRATLFVAASDAVADTNVTLTDGDGSQTVSVAVDRNMNNSGPFIEQIEDIRELGTGVGLIGARDIEGDPIQYHASVADDSGATVRMDGAWIHVDAPKGFIGTIEIDVAVSSAAGALQVDRFDRQRVSIEVNPDVDDDGDFDVADVDIMCQAAPFAGIDFDHQLDFFSITMGDVNLDGTFDSKDLIRLFAVAQYEDDIPLNSRWSTGDFDCDGDFDTGDLVRAFEAATYTNE